MVFNYSFNLSSFTLLPLKILITCIKIIILGITKTPNIESKLFKSALIIYTKNNIYKIEKIRLKAIELKKFFNIIFNFSNNNNSET